MISQDEESLTEVSHNCQLAINTLDKCLTQFLAVIQKFYKNRSKWIDAQHTKASIAMANATLNYHILARHSTLIGYSAEIEPLHRACFERMTRCAVFQLNEDLAEKFWMDKTIQQSNIRDLLSSYFEEKSKGTGEIANEIAKDMYRRLSKVSHPSIDNLKFRTFQPSKNIEKQIGIDFTFCGDRQEITKLLAISECITYILFSLFMMEIVSRKVFGSWGNVLMQKTQKLYREQDSLDAYIFKTINKVGLT